MMENTKEINLPSGDYIFVKIPDDAHSFREKLSYEGGYWLTMFEPRIEPYLAIQSIRIIGKSNDKFEIISTTKDITEEQIKSICQYRNNWLIKDLGLLYKDYNRKRYCLKTAKESLQSLLQANNLDVSKNYLILKIL